MFTSPCPLLMIQQIVLSNLQFYNILSQFWTSQSPTSPSVIKMMLLQFYLTADVATNEGEVPPHPFLSSMACSNLFLSIGSRLEFQKQYFLIFGPFQQFKVLFITVQKIYVKYALFVYVGSQERSFQIFFNFFPKEWQIMVICTQNVYSQGLMLFKLLHMAGSRSFFNQNFLEFTNSMLFIL